MTNSNEPRQQEGPKKIVVVSKNQTYEVQDIIRAAKIANVPLDVVDIQDLITNYQKYDEVGVLYWRTGSVSSAFPQKVGRSTTLSYIEQHTSIVNRSTSTSPHHVYKSVQQAKFQQFVESFSKIRPIKTFSVTDISSLQELIDADKLKFPFIAKPNLGKQGIGVKLIESEDDFLSIKDNITSTIFQNYIKNNGDYRVLVVGGVAHDIMLRTASKESEHVFLNNISQGGSARLVEDLRLRKQLAKAGCAVAAIFNYTICGVDFIEDEDGTIYFLEINSVPQWEGLSSVSPHNVGEHVIDTLVSITKRNTATPFEDIRDYYLKKLRFFPAGLQFHFLSRLHLMSGKRAYKTKIENIRDGWWSDMNNVLYDLDAMRNDKERPAGASAKKYRLTASKKHPDIGAYNKFFFKCIFDETIFDGNTFSEHKLRIETNKIREVHHQLISDPSSVLALSTHAVNFLYFCDYYFADEGLQLDPGYFLAVGDTERLDVQENDVDARIYMYTHAIIGATRFYSEPISEHTRDMYVEMLKRIEKIISKNYARTTLDHKSEFLVCCRLCNYESYLEPIIKTELLSSISPNGLYFVNTLNTHKKNIQKQSMIVMEHTNVLALMAFLDPHNM